MINIMIYLQKNLCDCPVQPAATPLAEESGSKRVGPGDLKGDKPHANPRCSMYGRFTYIRVIFRVNVGKYSIHGAYRCETNWQKSPDLDLSFGLNWAMGSGSAKVIWRCRKIAVTGHLNLWQMKYIAQVLGNCPFRNLR